MRAFVPILGETLATAADAYLRSVSPQAELERQKIQAERELLPLQVQAEKQTLPLSTEKLRREVEAPRILSLGGGRAIAVTKQADGTWKAEPVAGSLGAGKQYKQLSGRNVVVTENGVPRLETLPETDAVKQMQADAWKRIEAMGGLTPENMANPELRSLVESVMNRQSEFVTTDSGVYPKSELLRTRPGSVSPAPVAPSATQPATEPGTYAYPTPQQKAAATPQAQQKPSVTTVTVKTDEDVRDFFSKLKARQAYDIITQLPDTDPQKAQFIRIFPEIFKAQPSLIYEKQWQDPVSSVQRQPVLPPNAPQPVVPSARAERQATQDLQQNQTELQRLNIQKDDLQLRQQNATDAREKAKIAEEQRDNAQKLTLARNIETATRPEQQQLLAIKRSEDITNTLLPLISPESYGPYATSRYWLQRQLGKIPPIARKQMEDLRTEAMDEARSGRLVPGDRQENSYWYNLFTKYDPRGDQIQFYLSVLAYAHAKAQVQGQALRQGDIRRADEIITNAQTPAQLYSVLKTNRDYLTREAGRLNQSIADKRRRLSAGVRPGAGAVAPEATPATEEAPTGDPNSILNEIED
jgi:hypothetical protein